MTSALPSPSCSVVVGRRLRRAARTGAARWCLVGLLLALLCAPATTRAEETITVWAMGEEGKRLGQMADRFERRFPGVRVEIQAIPWSAAEAKLLTAVVGEITPDVVQLGTTYLPKLAAMGALEPLGQRLARATELRRESFFEGPLATASFRGQLYGIPWYIDTWVLYYRTDILQAAGFEHPPRTWQELREVGLGLTVDRDRDGKPDRHGLALSPTDAGVLAVLAAQAGGYLVQDGAVGVRGAGFREALRFFISLFDDNIAPRSAAQDTDLYQAFEEGLLPMLIGGPWMLQLIDKQCPKIRGKWSVATLPRHRRASSFVGGSVLALFRRSRHKALAWRFIEFMSQTESQIAWYQISTTLPPTRTAWASPLLRRDPRVAVFGQQLEVAEAPPAIPEWEEIRDKVGRDYLAPLVFHQQEIDVALPSLEREVAQMLDKRRGGGRQSPALKIVVLGAVAAGIVGLVVLLLVRRSRRVRESGGLDVRDVRSAFHVPYLYLSPAMAILLVFLFIPIIVSFLMSLTDWNIYAITDWDNITVVGLNNYRSLMWELDRNRFDAIDSVWGYLAFWSYLGDPVFWRSLFNTFYFVVVGVPLSICVSLVAALGLNLGFLRAKSIFRVGFFMPVVTTMVAVAVVWRWLYNPRFGLINHLLERVGLTAQDWLGDPALAMPALIVMAVWKNFGYNMIIFLAALQGIPQMYHEAAKIDGASGWQRFRYVTLPLLAPTMYFVSIMTLIGYFQLFAEPYVMTQGGPLNSTMSIVLYMYNHGFKFYNLGYATAIAFVLFIFISGFTVAQTRFSRRAFNY